MAIGCQHSTPNGGYSVIGRYVVPGVGCTVVLLHDKPPRAIIPLVGCAVYANIIDICTGRGKRSVRAVIAHPKNGQFLGFSIGECSLKISSIRTDICIVKCQFATAIIRDEFRRTAALLS